jgi:hypothetical protein
VSKTTEWQDILGALRGRRLAVLDELCSGLVPDQRDLKVQEALGWLVYHRFVQVDEASLVPRSVLEAQRIWRADGPARELAGRMFQHVAPPVSEPPGAEVAPRPAPAAREAGLPAAAAVHQRRPSQPELFA